MIKAGQTVTVGSYNVKNMFAKEDIAPGNRTRPKPEFELEALSRVLKNADADVVALQELSSEKTLKNFMKEYGLDKIYPNVAHINGNSDRNINVGIISKYPFETVVTHKDQKFPLIDGSGDTKFSRDLLRVDVNTDGQPGAELTVYTTHSKSRRPSEGPGPSSDTQRASEGREMRRIVEEEMKPYPNRLFVMTGDWNDNTNDASVQEVLNPKSGEKFVDSLADLPANERNIWPANPNAGHGHDPEQFDHIVYSQSMAGQMQGSTIHRYNATDDGKYKWLSSAASDHLMISAKFKLPE